jgi:transcriptional regulator with XRE-family HTH domain
MPKSVFSNDYRRLVRLLIQFRREAELTQVEVAERLGRSQSYVSKIERCERRLDVVEYCELVRALDHDPVKALDAFLVGSGAA